MVGFRHGFPEFRVSRHWPPFVPALIGLSCPLVSALLCFREKPSHSSKIPWKEPGSDLWPARKHASARLRHLSSPSALTLLSVKDSYWSARPGLSWGPPQTYRCHTLPMCCLWNLHYPCQFTAPNRKPAKGLAHTEENCRGRHPEDQRAKGLGAKSSHDPGCTWRLEAGPAQEATSCCCCTDPHQHLFSKSCQVFRWSLTTLDFRR